MATTDKNSDQSKQVPKSEKVFLKDFLETFSLSSAEILRYEKIHKKNDQPRSHKEWSTVTGLNQSTKDKK